VRAAAGTRLRQGCGAQGGLPALPFAHPSTLLNRFEKGKAVEPCIPASQTETNKR